MMDKKLIITAFLLLFFFGLKAQGPEKGGYIGVGIGPSFLLGNTFGESRPAAGVNVTLLNFGYVLDKGFGITAILSGGVHLFDSNVNSGSSVSEIRYSAFMVGPMYTLKLSENSSLDIKVRGGLFHIKEKESEVFAIDHLIVDGTEETIRPGYSFAVTYRMKFATHWCMLVSCDYYSGKIDTFSSNGRLTALSLNGGIGFLF